jgi:hypothetical protein
MREKSTRERLPVLSRRREALLGVWLLCLLLFSKAYAQDADVGLPVQPAPEVRLTGTLEAPKNPLASAYPVLSVWIDGTPWIFRISQVEPVIAAYPAEQELQKVSGLGLRLLANKAVLTTLQSPEMHDRPIVIEGWLRVSEGVLRVQSVTAKSGS